MLVDANILLHAVDSRSRHHRQAKAWLTDQLLGARRVGLPWESLVAFVRIATHPRATERPLQPEEAWRFVADWLAVPVVWTPVPTPEHGQIFGQLVSKYGLTGNLIPDGHLAALALEHGLEIWSADTDFARFTEIRWRNPLAD
ncbi:MAG: ribonuclease VapC [Chloroflexota bacterium]|nr:MAG: ribonuclease VapC [Chloroflexota bacterium]